MFIFESTEDVLKQQVHRCSHNVVCPGFPGASGLDGLNGLAGPKGLPGTKGKDHVGCHLLLLNSPTLVYFLVFLSLVYV